MLFAEPSESIEPLEISEQKIENLIINTHGRINRALNELDPEKSYSALNAEIIFLDSD